MNVVKLKCDIIGDLARIMEAETRAGERAVSAAIGAAGTGLKTAWRGQITGAGLGARLANTIHAKNYPEGRASLSAASLIWSKAPVIVGAHDAGVTVRAHGGSPLEDRPRLHLGARLPARAAGEDEEATRSRRACTGCARYPGGEDRGGVEGTLSLNICTHNG